MRSSLLSQCCERNKVKAGSCLQGLGTIRTYHVTGRGGGRGEGAKTQNPLARKRKKWGGNDREGPSEREVIKGERGKDKRHLGTEVEGKKELQDPKLTISLRIFVSFLFPQRRFISLTDMLLPALSQKLARRS